MNTTNIIAEKRFVVKWWKVPIVLATVSLFIPQLACKKLVDAALPSNVIAQENVYSNDATSIAVLTGIYTNMTLPTGSGGEGFTGNFGISLMCGLLADELNLYSVDYPDYTAYYTNHLSATAAPPVGSEYWAPLYNYIYICNAAISGLNGSNTLTPEVKQQLLGEAKFMRAFVYFYLVNFFGDVPLVLTTDYKTIPLLPRAPQAEVYTQIIADLKDAQGLLSTNFLDPTLLSTTTERVRPTSWAATALLSRAYLYKQVWDSAEIEASTVINNSSQFSLDSVSGVFLKNSSEAIWQLQPTASFFNTLDAVAFIIPSFGVSDVNPAALSGNLLNSFEPGDERAVLGNWIDTISINGTYYYYPYKYKVNSQDPSVLSASSMIEYEMVQRLGELFLIRAEARAQQNNTVGAQSDLNIIRNRAGLGNSPANDKNALLVAILHERQVELFTEWGQRWFDLKRTSNIDTVMSAVTPQKANGAPWQSYQQLFPLSLVDLKLSPMLKQNSGY